MFGRIAGADQDLESVGGIGQQACGQPWPAADRPPVGLTPASPHHSATY